MVGLLAVVTETWWFIQGNYQAALIWLILFNCFRLLFGLMAAVLGVAGILRNLKT